MNKYIFETYKAWNGKYETKGRCITLYAKTHEAAHKEALQLKPDGFELGAVAVIKQHTKEVDKPVPMLTISTLSNLSKLGLRVKVNSNGYDLFRTDALQQYQDFGFRKQPISEVLGLLAIGLSNWIISNKSQYRKLTNSKRKKRGFSEFSPFER